MANKVRTQAQAILDYVNLNGSITSYEAFLYLGITRLASRMWDLKQAGYLFRKEKVQKTSQYGTVTFAKYIPLTEEDFKESKDD